jgi:hypothetical protein
MSKATTLQAWKDPRLLVAGACIIVWLIWLVCRSGIPSSQTVASSTPASPADAAPPVDPAVYIDAIRSVIAQDKMISNHTTKNLSLWETVAGYNAATIDQIVDKLRAINTDRCPPDFRKAYQSHVKAWSDYAAAIHGQGSTSQAEKYVEATWYEVHRVAQEYGISDAIQ